MKPLRRRHPHPEIPLVSTADVSFLLLIFFLATAVFQVERGILLGLPAPGAAPRAVASDRIARVTVGADRSLRLDGETVAAGTLRDALRRRLERRPGTLVTLEIHPRAPYDALVQTLDQVKLSGARDISLRTAEGA
ncbi:MAG TPA: biopolymer transporter ExbD [Candidatus Eisenbacteria bacterium]|nr:biopolymer transporter ExbD [Candidatus Eisenbacteria bacterium]